MTSEVSNHVVPEPICIRLDDTTDNGQRPPGLDGVDRTHGRFAGPVNEQPVFVCDIAGRKRRVGVTVHPTDVGGDVDVDDVASVITVESGIPWQMTSLRDVQHDFGNPL